MKDSGVGGRSESLAPIGPATQPFSPSNMGNHTGGGRGRESGIALFLTLAIMLSLSALALSMVLLTDSQIRLCNTMESRTQIDYAAQAGLEEARSRLTGNAPDLLITLPQHTNDVLYIVNSGTQEMVNPTDPSSPYYDAEYAQEFPGGLASAHL